MAELKASKFKLGSMMRVVGVIAVIGVLFAAIIASTNQKVSSADKVWDQATTLGNLDAKNYFVIYSDIACPYCVAFENAILENEGAFNHYLEDNDILLEVRVSDFLYEYGETHPQASRDSAIGIYCAKEQGKFWSYYNHAIKTVWEKYFKSGGKAAAAEMDKLTLKYWEDLGKDVGLSDDFVDCMENGDVISEIEENALKSAKNAGGLPYFKFNNYISSGFNLDWGWDYVLMYFEAGLKS